MSEFVTSRIDGSIVDGKTRTPLWARRAAAAGALGLGVALLTGACGGNGEAQPTKTVTQTAPAEGGTATHRVPTSEGTYRLYRATSGPIQGQTKLTFNYLNGNDKTVQVYAGPEKTEHDQQPVGGFPDGETVPVECATEGRDVTSQPGEDERESNAWLRFQLNGKEAYATAVYGDITGVRPPKC